MQIDAFARCHALPAWRSLRATQDQQQLVVPILFAIFAASVLRCVTSSVRCHPYLQASNGFLIVVKLLVDKDTSVAHNQHEALNYQSEQNDCHGPNIPSV